MAQFDTFERIMKALQEALGLASSRAVVEFMFRGLAKSVGDEEKAHRILIEVLSDGDKVMSKVVASLLPLPAATLKRPPGRPPAAVDRAAFALNATIELALLHGGFKDHNEIAQFVKEGCEKYGLKLGRKTRAKDETGVDPDTKLLKRIGRLRSKIAAR